MTKKTVKQLIVEAVSHLSGANISMVYNKVAYNLIPLKTSSQLFLAINENDFIFDGFRISRFRDIQKVRININKFNEIIRGEGLFDGLSVPEINLTSWQAVFEGLKQTGKNIIVEYETAEGTNDIFTIGRIDRIYKSCLYMYHFYTDGTWEPEPYRIPYSEVTSVTFDSRYVNVFSKYLPDPPKLS